MKPKLDSKLDTNSKRIAKNTILLYGRTFITMLVGLYTSRIMLEALGVDNYGINSVVGGIVGMSSIITVSMSVAISRYLTFFLGQGNINKLKVLFSTAVNAQILMSAISIFVLEIAGLWFLNTTANIPPTRLYAAHWVFQCSIICLVLSLISAPYNSLIIAHEKMSIYAYMGIFDVVMRLLICYILLQYNGDRLILLAITQVILSLITRIFYGWYCGRNFEEAEYSITVFDKKLIKELTAFSGWNLMNNCTWIFAHSGVGLLVNVFFGVVFNASRAIASSVSSAVQVFVRNFTVALTPQITKHYATGNIEDAKTLAIRGAKFTWLMTFVFIVPICMEAETLLKLWLVTVPDDAALFLRLTLFESLASISSNQLFQLLLADGRLKKVNIQNAIVTGLIFPSVWIAYRLGAPVWASYLICTVIFLSLNLVFLYNLRALMGLKIRTYYNLCVKPCILVSFVSFVLPLCITPFFNTGIIKFIAVCFISIAWTLVCCYWIGLSKSERNLVSSEIKTVLCSKLGLMKQ